MGKCKWTSDCLSPFLTARLRSPQQNTNNLGGNDLLNFVISGAVELPAYTFLIFTLNRWGRKTILCSSMLTVSVLSAPLCTWPHPLLF